MCVDWIFASSHRIKNYRPWSRPENVGNKKSILKEVHSFKESLKFMLTFKDELKIANYKFARTITKIYWFLEVSLKTLINDLYYNLNKMIQQSTRKLYNNLNTDQGGFNCSVWQWMLRFELWE